MPEFSEQCPRCNGPTSFDKLTLSDGTYHVRSYCQCGWRSTRSAKHGVGDDRLPDIPAEDHGRQAEFELALQHQRELREQLYTGPFKSIPTSYAGVNFRSRLEARWAAMLDLMALSWDYEPCDLSGWTPDFLIKTPFCPVFAEIKPVDNTDDPMFGKARKHWREVQVLLLCREPVMHDFFAIGALLDPPEQHDYMWDDLHEYLGGATEWMWREAGNRVQWHPD